MPIDAGIYAAFAPRQRGVLEYANDFAGLDAAKEAQATNVLSRQMGQAKFDEYQRGVQNATSLQQLMGSMAGKSDADVLTGLRGAGRFNEAGSFEKGILDRQKLATDTRKDAATADKTDFERKQAERKQAIMDIAILPDAAAARQSISAKVTEGILPMQQAQSILAALPQDPSQFAQWKSDLILKLASPDAQQSAATQQRGQNMTAATAAAGQQVTRETAAQADARIRAEGAANRGVQMRGQNMVDARSRQTIEQDGATSPPPTMGLPRPTVVPWANQTNARDANKVKATEMSRGAKEVEKDDEAAKAAAVAAADAKRFLELNAQTSSGGASRVGAVRAVRGAFSSDVSEMESITARLAPAMRQPGSGATSDYDAKMFERSTVGLDKPKEANDAIAAGIIARAEQAQGYAMFRQSYLEQNGTLQGADRYWRSYINANPIFDPKSKTPKVNTGRKPWQQHFSGEAAPVGSTPPPPGVVDFSSLK